MRAFWWFEDNSIAGMARPGFNNVHWFDLPFDEAVVVGWIGQYSSGSVGLDSFHRHLNTYVPKIHKFYQLNEKTAAQAVEVFDDPSGFMKVLEKISKRTGIFGAFEIAGDHLHFQLNGNQLAAEIEFLKSKGIRRVISLTERHHETEILGDHFTLHHLGIEDLSAPKVEQARELAGLIRESKNKGEALAVHCLAGIGRTSTMLLAAHLLLGHRFQDLEALITKRNPSFILTGPQGEFLRALENGSVSF